MDDRSYMQQALSLARKAYGNTSPNPMVGAVVVANGQVVGDGYHHAAGTPHAEVHALREAGDRARGATLYVTLEPCAHHGRTPPCTQAILESGIARVIFAVRDPNPLVAGNGQRILEESDILVTTPLLAEEARWLNRAYFHWIQTRMPYIVAKFAMSMDGKIATESGESKWITGLGSRGRSYELRQWCDAIVIGAATAIADNPQLTNRWEGGEVARKNPLRVVVDSTARSAAFDLTLFSNDSPARTVLACTTRTPLHVQESLAHRGVRVWILPSDSDGRVDLLSLYQKLGEEGCLAVLVEGGAELLGSHLTAGLVQEVWTFVAPILMGGSRAPSPIGGKGFAQLSESIRLRVVHTEQIDSDWFFQSVVEQH